MTPSLISGIGALLSLLPSALAVNNGLAQTPALGWNNWNSLGCDVSEDLLLGTSRKLLDLGLRDVGYNYVVLDDCWSDGRGTDGKVRVDLQRFPHGMKWMSAQMHDLDLKFGMYSSAGHMTCARYEGSLDYETEDAQSWADWDIDYLKYDNCYHMGRFGTPEVTFNRYNKMAKALNATGRHILYSLCSWGEDSVHTWAMSIANSWRVSGDIYDSFTRPDTLCSCTNPADPLCIAPGSHCSVMNILNRMAPFADRGQPGGWNDLDGLEVGMGGMTDEEYKAHFAMWCAVKSVLLIGADIRDLSPSALTILNNPALLAVSQDPLGRSALRVQHDKNVKKDRYGEGETQVWSGPLTGGDQLVVLLNAADEDLEMVASLNDIFVHDGPEGSAPQTKQTWNIHDLWGHRMDDSLASKIISSSITVERAYKQANWFNSTETSYAEALGNGDERLLGKKIGQVQPGSEIKAMVPRHGAAVYRLRSDSGSSRRYATYKTEL